MTERRVFVALVLAGSILLYALGRHEDSRWLTALAFILLFAAAVLALSM